MEVEHVRSRFIKHFDGTTGTVYASPGRINLIGEHTDYNGGFVFPGAIDKVMMAELKRNGTNKVRAYSIDMKDYVEFGFEEADAPRTSWAARGFEYRVCGGCTVGRRHVIIGRIGECVRVCVERYVRLGDRQV